MNQSGLAEVRLVEPFAYWLEAEYRGWIDQIDDEEVLSSTRKRRDCLRTLRQLCARKVLSPVPKEAEADLGALTPRYPNATEAIEAFIDAYHLAMATEGPFRLPSVLLVGPPGTGKTSVAHALAGAVSPVVEMLHLAFHQEAFGLSGLDLGYTTGGPGVIAEALATHNIANFVWVVDEVDKTGKGGERTSPFTPLFQLLEQTTAKRFKDLALDIEVDASWCSWVLTANDLTKVPRPIVDRCLVFQIDPPTPTQMPAIIKSVWADVRQELRLESVLPKALPVEVEDRLRGYAPRQLKRVLTRTAARAIRRGRSAGAREERRGPRSARLKVTVGDIPPDCSDRHSRSIGFVWE